MEEGEDLELLFTMTDYLPYVFKDQVASDYFENLIDFSTKNLIDKDPHFSIAALHMVYMGAAYNYLYGLYRLSPKRFDSILIGFHHMIPRDVGIRSWQDFSLIHESSIFDFFRHVGLKETDIKELKAPVKARNDLVHSNGMYVVDTEAFVSASKSMLRCIGKIENACFPGVKKLFFRFVRSEKVDLYDTEDAIDYLRTYFFAEYAVSKRAVSSLSEISFSEYPDRKNSKKFFDALKWARRDLVTE